ncbi:MAG: gliding motility-associated C-terminal domain-containing protein [Bacteroidetes bacterium]|nr:gliding motility-associated C-terminal domain-containing protein [Bacteroidota bacterium]
MTLFRFLAIAYCFLLLLPAASGQTTETPEISSQLKAEQGIALDTVALDSTGGTLVIPNVFTPNGDGIHDYFEVETNGVSVYDFTVFTRTGARVFHSNSPRIFWDGTNSAALDLKEGVYYYVIEEEEGNTTPYSSAGFIYLFR